jgi:EpsI family protein
MHERVAVILLCCVLVLGGAMTWWLELRPPLEVDVSPLRSLPARLDDWTSVEVDLDDRVARELAADFNIQRAYQHPTGQLVWLYLGYYSTERGGRPEHTPRGCYTGAGWELLDTRVLRVGGGRVQEFVMQRDGEHRLVHFWFRSHRQGGLAGGIDFGLDRVIGKLTTGRADGALIRISTPMRGPDEAGAARARLASFRSRLVPQIAERWPTERTSDAAARSSALGARGGAERRDAGGVEERKGHHLRGADGHLRDGRASRGVGA